MMAVDIGVEESAPASGSEWSATEVRTLAAVLGFVFGLAFFGPAGAAVGAGGSWLFAKIANPG